jgi:hypothetical protein
VYPNYGGLSDDLQGSSRAPRGLACTSTECRCITLLVLSPPVPWAAVRRKPSVKGRNRTNEPTDGFSLWSLGLSLSSCVSLLRFQVSQCSTPATILVSIEQCFDCPENCSVVGKGACRVKNVGRGFVRSPRTSFLLGCLLSPHPFGDGILVFSIYKSRGVGSLIVS